MNIVNLSQHAMLVLAEAVTRADVQGVKFRLAFEPQHGNTPASVCFKVGGGMWSAPFYDQLDEFRDQRQPLTVLDPDQFQQ